MACTRLQTAVRLHLKILLVNVVCYGCARSSTNNLADCLQVANAIYYNPVVAATVLHELGAMSTVFDLWLNILPQYTRFYLWQICYNLLCSLPQQFFRIHDKKLTVLAFSSLLSVPSPSRPSSLDSCAAAKLTERCASLIPELWQMKEGCWCSIHSRIWFSLYGISPLL